MSTQEDFDKLAQVVKELSAMLVKLTDDRDAWYKRAKAQENCEHYVELPPTEGDWMVCDHMKGTGLAEKLRSLQEQVKTERTRTLEEVTHLVKKLTRFQPNSGSGVTVLEEEMFFEGLKKLSEGRTP